MNVHIPNKTNMTVERVDVVQKIGQLVGEHRVFQAVASAGRWSVEAEEVDGALVESE
jgi:hypothetical protein